MSIRPVYFKIPARTVVLPRPVNNRLGRFELNKSKNHITETTSRIGSRIPNIFRKQSNPKDPFRTLLTNLKSQDYYKALSAVPEAQQAVLDWFVDLINHEDNLTRRIDLDFTYKETQVHTSISPFEWFNLLISNVHSSVQKLQLHGLKSLDQKKKSQIDEQDLRYTRGNFFEQRFDLVASILKPLGLIEKLESFNKSHWQDRAGVDKFLHFKVDDRIYGLPIQLKPTVEAAKSFFRKIISTTIKQSDTTQRSLSRHKIDEYILWQNLCCINSKPKSPFTGDEPEILAKRKNILRLPMQEFSIEYLIKFFSALVNLDSSICSDLKLRDSASAGHSSMNICLNSSAKSLKSQEVKLTNTVDFDQLSSETARQRVFGELYITGLH
ncbi:MAG: hypothetical protein HOA17_06280 [Candidatus Melainabacteria bacterium]|nr:hypothetical protein [Candidatus Melainabacteria bacterium]